ncbi:MAG: AraC family transcriptional regulator ligand-binding domain-containing protein [Halioglobus sp.]
MPRLLEISSAYARLALQSELLPPERALAGTGLTEAELAELEFIDWRILAQMFDNIDTFGTIPDWAPLLGSRLNITAHGPLGFAAISAPTLGESLQVMGTLYPVRNSAIRVDAGLEQGRYYLWLEDLTGDECFFRVMSEIILKVAESLLSAILGHPVGANVSVAFAHPPPAGARQITAAYDATVEFDAERYSISVPEAWCALPSPLFDEQVYRANVIRCREIIAKREGPGSASAFVVLMLSNHFDHMVAGSATTAEPPTLEDISEAMHLTSRTLIRRLKKEGTNYKGILENQRRDYAQQLLRDARLQVAEVGEILGYREPANFGRAFRRWFGASPAAWRRQ